MKKILIGSLVASLILFVWSFLAWALLPVHLHTFMYTPAQDSVLKILENNNIESGAYAMPMADNRNISGFDKKFMEESERLMKANAGKPMASIFYLKGGYNMGATTMLRGFLFDFLMAWAACMLLMPGMMAMSSFLGRWWLTLLVGVLLSAAGPLIQFNWMGMPWNYTADMVIDNMLNWGITGIWLAYYFKPKS